MIQSIEIVTSGWEEQANRNLPPARPMASAAVWEPELTLSCASLWWLRAEFSPETRKVLMGAGFTETTGKVMEQEDQG